MIELVNNKTWVIVINDLGIELQPGERIELSNLTDKQIVESIDLPTVDAIFELDGTEIDYTKMIEYTKKITHIDHINEKTHAHNVRESNFFDTEKVDGATSKITYFTDATKTVKVREEEIIRDVDGKVAEIISTVYKYGEIEEVEIQTLNRIDGKVDSISTVIE